MGGSMRAAMTSRSPRSASGTGNIGGVLSDEEIRIESGEYMDGRLGVLDLAETVDAFVGDHTDDRTVPDDSAADVKGLHSVMLILRSLAFDDAGMPLERFAGFHRGDLSRFLVDVHGQHPTE